MKNYQSVVLDAVRFQSSANLFTERVSYKTLPCVPPTGKRGSWNCDLRKLDYIPYDIFERKQRL
jgi:hypothetical protein